MIGPSPSILACQPVIPAIHRRATLGSKTSGHRICFDTIGSHREGDVIGRGRRPVSLQERLAAFARLNREAAEKLPPGTERDMLLEKARKADEATDIGSSTKRRQD
jgi:hypothetical protein